MLSRGLTFHQKIQDAGATRGVVTGRRAKSPVFHITSGSFSDIYLEEDMAKKKAEAAKTKTKEPESMAGYFKRIFAEDRKLLKERSNEKLLQRWLADHPDQTEVPQSVKASLANTKSVLRSKGRKKAANRKEEGNGQKIQVQKAGRPRTAVSGLEQLELQIDDCLSAAKFADPEGL